MVLYWYWRYIFDIFKGKTKPHLFSWIIFVLLDIIVFLIQYNDNAGPWAWWTFITGLVALIVTISSIFYWEKNITKSDIASFILALLSIFLYIYLDNPVYALILMFIILTLAFYPTFRKSFYKPNEETLSMYIIAGIRSFIGIFATIHISFLTIGLPIFIIIINTCFIVLVLYRKKHYCNLLK